MRTTRGGILPFVVACVAVLVVVIAGALYLGVIFSGEQKVRSVVDAGALSIAQQASDLRVPAPSMYEDCADSNGKIGLVNINRVIGKAMLINMNAEDMEKSGQAASSSDNAAQAETQADALDAQVRDKVTDSNAEQSGWGAVAPSKTSDGGSVSSSSSDGKTGSAQPQFDHSFIHRGSESNLTIDDGQFPEMVKLPPDAVVTQGAQYVKGYQPIKANGKDFYFVPFRQKELPHLIPIEEFNANKKQTKPLGWGSAIPNAFQVTANGGVAPNMVSVASAVANPQSNYALAIPHAYISIRLQPTQVMWKINDKIIERTKYDFKAERQNGIKKKDVGCGKLDGFASLGNEYKSIDLYSIINDSLPGDHEPAFKLMTQRLKEIDKSFTKEKLEELLRSQSYELGEYEYLLYPEYSSKDNTDPKIRIATKGNASGGWINKQVTPDGMPKQVVSEKLKDKPNESWCVVVGQWKLSKSEVNVVGQMNWTPSTGANQHLGELSIIRTCTVEFIGKCPDNSKSTN